MTKLVTIVIPTYNSENFIKRCIDKVIAQTYKNIEIITIDDGSSDNTVKILNDYKIITVLQNNTNQGPAYSRTRGLKEANGEYVTFLDSDDYWDENFISSTVNFLEKYLDAVAVSTGYIGIDLKGNKSVAKPILCEEDADYYNSEGSLCPDFFEFWSKYFGVLTGTVMMRTELAKKTGGQRSELRLTEDLEFWGYLSTFGKWGFIPQALFITDPGILKPNQRLKKMKDRYNFFVDLDIDDWFKRIKKNHSSDKNTVNKILNHIKTTIVVANVYTYNFDKSYSLVGLWNKDLESGLGGVLKKWHKLGKMMWPVISVVFRFREFLKSYISYYIRVFKK